MGDQVKPPLTHFLISCSFSPSARLVTAQGLALARLLNAKVSFCHVGFDQPHVRGQMQLILDDIGADKQAPLIIQPGRPHKVLSAVAARQGSDLIVAGALKHENSVVGIFGSVARRLVRQAACSVLLLTADASSNSWRALGVSIDYDQTPRGLMELAITLARAKKIPLHVVHENDYQLRYLQLEAVADQRRVDAYERECDALEHEQLNNYIQGFDLDGVDIYQECLLSEEGDELSNYSRKHEIDMMLVTAAKQSISWWQRFLNPPVEIILQDLPCSILFYKS